MTPLEKIARAAKAASRRLAVAPTAAKDKALLAIASALELKASEILAANAEDVAEATSLKLARPLVDRLKLDRAKLREMAEGVRAVAALPDPSGRVLARTLLDDGLELVRVSCPLGVLAVVFESRPDAVTQIGALALKSGNAVVLKGGREASRSASALVRVIHEALACSTEIPVESVSLVGGREDVDRLLLLDDCIDLVIPRGGNALVRYVQEHTRIPVLGHAEGICHVYVDAAADPEKAIAIVHDSKLQYPAACNAAETLLVHRDAAPRLLDRLLETLRTAGVELRACDRTRALAPTIAMKAATDDDWRTEHGGPTLSVKLVDSLDDAIEHVNRYGSGHTDAIVTEDAAAAERFLDSVDSASVFHNASTRFADGFRYGFGAEVGISTSKLHARGPVGLEGLVSTKYKLYGSGQIVATYSGEHARPFKHAKREIH
ncbi:MAG: glutamate-5-semialdehyde dehydrogenase [Planctomycetes bacterium]|nr:glutamate-5-semialdehyde dehydrogenase [Planctomycetota bacterium]